MPLTQVTGDVISANVIAQALANVSNFTITGALTGASVTANNSLSVVSNTTSSSSSTGILSVGGALSYTDSGIIASFTSNTAGYNYVAVQNKSPANTAYSSYAVYNNTGNYMEIGVNSSNYSYSAAGYPNNTLSLACLLYTSDAADE